MRWSLVARAWTLARNKFPNVKRLYVDIPGRFGATGSCAILDLDTPGTPLGAVSYDVRPINGEPRMVLALDDSSVSVGLPKIGAQASIQSTVRRAGRISAETISKRYPNSAEFAARVAQLAIGHEDGIKCAASGLKRSDVSQWLRTHGFQPSILDAVCYEIGNTDPWIPVADDTFNNVRVARKDKNHFDQFQRVRIKDERSMEYQECGQVLEVKGSMKDGYFYSVLVDGSESPLWFPEMALDDLHAGWIAPENPNAV